MPLSLLLKHRNALVVLCFFHILVIVSSNYLVQIPFQLGPMLTTWGAITFPFIFLFTDLTVRVFGALLARKIIFYVMFPALIISYTVSVIFVDGNFVGFQELSTFNLFVFRIALASFLAYLVGQLLDITVFNYFRKHHRWWVAPSLAAVFGNLIDAVCFFFVAFYKSTDPFMAANWVEIAAVDYLFKIIICGLFFLPLYGVVLHYILAKLDQLDASTKSALNHSQA